MLWAKPFSLITYEQTAHPPPCSKDRYLCDITGLFMNFDSNISRKRETWRLRETAKPFSYKPSSYLREGRCSLVGLNERHFQKSQMSPTGAIKVLVCNWGLSPSNKCCFQWQGEASSGLWEIHFWKAAGTFFFHHISFFFYILFILRTYVCMPTWMLWDTCGSQDNLWKLLLSFVTWVQGFNSGCRAWWQMPLPAEPSHQPPKTLWNVTNIYQLLPYFGCIELKFDRSPDVVGQWGPHHY